MQIKGLLPVIGNDSSDVTFLLWLRIGFILSNKAVAAETKFAKYLITKEHKSYGGGHESLVYFFAFFTLNQIKTVNLHLVCYQHT